MEKSKAMNLMDRRAVGVPAVASARAARQSAAQSTAVEERDAPAKTRLYIVHGYAATPSDHWFPWLEKTLTDKGVDATVLALPNPHAPDPGQWLEHLAGSVGACDANTFFVAHSLGCITLLRYLEALDAGREIGGIVLVSGFAAPLPELPQLDAFTAGGIDARQIVRIVPRRAVIASRDDAIVPYRLPENLSRAISAPLYSVEHGGHFLASDGFRTLPVVCDVLERWIEMPAGARIGR